MDGINARLGVGEVKEQHYGIMQIYHGTISLVVGRSMGYFPIFTLGLEARSDSAHFHLDNFKII